MSFDSGKLVRDSQADVAMTVVMVSIETWMFAIMIFLEGDSDAGRVKMNVVITLMFMTILLS